MSRQNLLIRSATYLFVMTLAAGWPAGAYSQSPGPAFLFGLAAGDVRQSSAILWTRADSPGLVDVQVSLTQDFTQVVQTASAQADLEHDLTIKIAVDGLEPWTQYYYRFQRHDDPNQVSRTGTFRTAPDVEQPREFTFAFSGDADQTHQPFFLLDSIVADQPAFFIFDGDTIYADIPAETPAADLDSFRAKYKDNRDSYMQDLYASMAMWPMWDDHEVQNNYAGATDPAVAGFVHQAYQAFFEYQPITPSDEFRTYRSLRYGSLAEFFFLDGRQYRSPEVQDACGGALDPTGEVFGGPPDETCVKLLQDPSRTMLGPQQLTWLLSGLKNSTTKYKFIVSDVPMTSLGILPYDNWQGYQAERNTIWQFIAANQIEGVIVLAADAHANVYTPDVTHIARTTQAGVLPATFTLPEFIAGPIATTTEQREVLGYGPALLGLPSNLLLVQIPFLIAYADAFGAIRRANDVRFANPDQYAYLLVRVQENNVSFEFKGISPDAAQLVPAKLMYQTTLPPQGGLPCALFALPPAAGLALLCRRLVTIGR